VSKVEVQLSIFQNQLVILQESSADTVTKDDKAVTHEVTRVQVASGKVTVLFHVGVQVTRTTVLVLATQLNVACHCNELLVQRCKLEAQENLPDVEASCHAEKVSAASHSKTPSAVHTQT
jgi:hypothetical protein